MAEQIEVFAMLPWQPAFDPLSPHKRMDTADGEGETQLHTHSVPHDHMEQAVKRACVCVRTHTFKKKPRELAGLVNFNDCTEGGTFL